MNREEKEKKLEELQKRKRYIDARETISDVYTERKFFGRLKEGDTEAISRTFDILEEEENESLQ